MKGKLHLIPTVIGEAPIERVLPKEAIEIVNKINFFIVENVRTARRYLIKAGIKTPIDDLTFFVLNKHTQPEEIPEFLKPITEGNDIGLLSEAGCPAVADPGADIVKIAHQKNIQIVPMVGPSSILLALMASGMNGQNFAFNGYLPVKQPARNKQIKFFEMRSQQEQQTQIFIEAPYRNIQLLKDMLTACSPSTKICIAADISQDDEFIKTKTAKEWKKKLPEINKRPTIFMIHK